MTEKTQKHPGQILQDEYLEPNQLSQNQLAKYINVSPLRINEIILGRRRITADTALRLGRYFQKPAEYWLKLQLDYDNGRLAIK